MLVWYNSSNHFLVQLLGEYVTASRRRGAEALQTSGQPSKASDYPNNDHERFLLQVHARCFVAHCCTFQHEALKVFCAAYAGVASSPKINRSEKDGGAGSRRFDLQNITTKSPRLRDIYTKRKHAAFQSLFFPGDIRPIRFFPVTGCSVNRSKEVSGNFWAVVADNADEGGRAETLILSFE